MSSLVITLGEALAVLRATSSGSLEHEPTLQIGTGGAEANVAIGLQRLGVDVTWFGRVGDDGFGRRVTRELRAEGVDVRVSVDTSAPTGAIIKEFPRPGHTRISYLRSGSAGSKLSIADLDPLAFDTAKLLHVSGVTAALSASALDTLDHAVELADARGIPISFDVNHRPKLWTGDEAAPTYQRIAARSTILFASADEASILLGRTATPADAARALWHLGPDVVVIKRGPLGALAFDGFHCWQRRALEVQVIDTVGAGDAFVAGFLSARLAGLATDLCLTRGVRAGAIACTHAGDWEGAARYDEISSRDFSLHLSDPVER